MGARGRKKGPRTVQFALRLKPEQKRKLEILKSSLDGAPPINGLIQLAVDRYLESKFRASPVTARNLYSSSEGAYPTIDVPLEDV